MKKDTSITNIHENFEDEYFWQRSCANGKDVEYHSVNVNSLTGYTSDELLSLKAEGKSLIIPEDKESYLKKIICFEKDASKTELSLDYRINKKNGETVWVNEKVKVVRDDAGKIKKWFGRVLETSEEKKQNELISQLIELNSSKDKFLSSISHNLKSPFTSILGFAEILMHEPSLSAKEKEEFISYIFNSSENLIKLIDHLLEWSRLQSGKTKIEPRRLSAQTIIYNSVSSLTGNAVRKNIEIKVSVPDSLFVQADERLLSQVLTGLLNNALKFSESEMIIEISASLFNEELIEFVIKDEGTGISDEIKNRLFKIEKLFSTEGTKGEKGSGLGLILAKEIVEKHKGQIWFYSEEGKGSEFHFTIPKSFNTILLVENNSEERMAYEKNIKEQFPSYKLISASNAYEALNNLTSFPSLIITSHNIPFMDGLKLVETICKNEKEMKTSIVVLTNESTEELRLAYKKYGESIILQKPLDLEQISLAIKKLFS